GGLDDFGLRKLLLALGLRALEDPFGLRAGPFDDVVAVADDGARASDLLGDRALQELDEIQDLLAVDERRRRQRHVARGTDTLFELAHQILEHRHLADRDRRRTGAFLFPDRRRGRIDGDGTGVGLRLLFTL